MTVTMTRRTALAAGAAAFAGTAIGLPARAGSRFAPSPASGWRRFEITTRIALDAGAPAKLWVPVPALDAAGWSRAGETRWSGNAASAGLGTDPSGRVGFVHAAWDAGGEAPVLEVVSRSDVRDRAADIDAGISVPPLSAGERAHFTAPTALIPTDGIVLETSRRITAGLEGDAPRARAIYEWIIAETSRDPETRGCGLGDVASMLEAGDLTGKCADLNALFVGLTRAAGIPARDVYGIRVAPSAFGYKSLGAGTPDVTRAQHCRSEVYLDGTGWIAADPADVRKVMLEEPPRDLALSDPKVAAVHEALFGAWEGNWIAFNDAHDVALPGADMAAAGGPLPFLMYPEAQVGDEWLDTLSPDSFSYTITARELTVA